MLEVLLESALRALVIAAGAALVLGLLRVGSAAVRHRVWTVVLFAMLLLPLWVQWGPQVSLRVLPAAPTSSPGPAVPFLPAVEPTSEATEVRSRTDAPTSLSESRSTSPSAAGRTWNWQRLLLMLYVFGAGVLLARLALGTVRVHALVRSARVRGGRLTSDLVATPITVGCLRPKVILPQGWEAWPAAQRAAVLAHERAHVRRRDALQQWCALLNRAVFWFHPLAWWLERRLAALAEEACDAAVIAQGHEPVAYSEYLLDLACTARRRRTLPGVVGMAMPGSALSVRIARILDGSAARTASRARVAGAAAVCALGSMALAAITLAQQVEPPAALGEFTPLGQYWHDNDEWRLEVRLIMTEEEAEEYRALQSVEGRERFIESFWARRDPTPETAVNEFKDEYQSRIDYVKQYFADFHPAYFGYQTPRGEIYVLFGPPDRLDAATEAGAYEYWHYDSVAGIGENVTIRIAGQHWIPICPRSYRIVSHPPRETFEGVMPFGADPAQRVVVQSYPLGFTVFSIPIDAGDIDHARFELKSGTGRPAWHAQLGDPQRRGRAVPDERSASGFDFDETGLHCSLRLSPGTYEFTVEAGLLSGQRFAEAVAFEVQATR